MARSRVALRLGIGLSALVVLSMLGGEVALRLSARGGEAGGPLSQGYSRVLHSRDGTPMAMSLAPDDRWRLPVDIEALPEDFVALLLAYEDKRFLAHDGVDRRALLRSAWQSVRAGRVVSGGSTLTMQLARLTGGMPRSLRGKWRQMVRARRLERDHDKPALLAAYLERAPYGGNIEGVEAAARLYFGRAPAALTLAEKALLVALPQAPEARRPDRHSAAALAGRNHVLDRLERLGALSPERAEEARRSPLTAHRRPPPREGRHLLDLLAQRHPDRQRFDTGLDPALQRRAMALAERIAPPGGQAALAVADLADGTIRAYVGGRERLDLPGGALDMLLAPRSPGSALKPFVYAMAYEARIAHPSTLAHDGPVDIGGYAPGNYHAVHGGDMTLRTALRRSVNTVAVMLADKVGAERAVDHLRRIAPGLDWAGEEPGLAFVLGGCSLPPLDLLRLYAALGTGGIDRGLRLMQDAPLPAPRRVFAADAVWAVTDSLAGSPPPPGRLASSSDRAGRRIAFKTGTSWGGRDAWAAGFDRDHAAIVWTGRADGASVSGMLGLEDAAPALHDLFAALPRTPGDVAGPPPPGSALAPRTALPPRWKWLDAGRAQRRLGIAEPRDGATLLAPVGTGIPLSAHGGRPPYVWHADGVAIDSASHRATYAPQAPGAVELSVIDASGARATANVWIVPGE